MFVAALASTFAVLALIVHAAGFIVLLRRLSSPRGERLQETTDVITVVRTIREVGPFEACTLRSTFELAHPRLEILFCAASPGDPAVPLVRQLIDAHPKVPARLLIGEDIVGANGKLNNMVKGWRESRASWVIFADSNLLLPADYVRVVLSTWSHGAGAVCAPPIGSQPQGLWAEVECAFLNGYQARWQYAADAAGLGFAQGKTMLLRRDIIERAGGITSLGCEPAEDAALTKVVRDQRLSVRLADPLFTQPLGHRSWQQMLDRQTRWAQLRRSTFPALYALEILSGMAAPLIAAMLAALWLDLSPVGIGAAYAVLWLGLEAAFTWIAGWHLGWNSPLAWLLREALLPAVWLCGLLQRSFQWGGQTVRLNEPLAGAQAEASF
jgi:ceramide glucosyltransferase